jgi:uncharacterized protein (TIGR03032 family)
MMPIGSTLSPSSEASEQAAPQFELDATRQFVRWLAEQQNSVGFNTYQSGKILLIGHNDNAQMSIFERTFEPPMGLWSDGQTLLARSAYQLHRFTNTLGPAEDADGYNRLFVPQMSYVTGDIDVHDIVMGEDNRKIVVISMAWQ